MVILAREWESPFLVTSPIDGNVARCPQSLMSVHLLQQSCRFAFAAPRTLMGHIYASRLLWRLFITLFERQPAAVFA